MADDRPGDRHDDSPDEEEARERPLGRFGDEERPQAEPAAGEAPLEHLVTGRFGDTTPDPPGRGGGGAEDGDADEDPPED